jgi:2-polyprenyl-3-methyl-5-hydroxy-6-metoxy-1,4-benzoquinol methylase
VIGWDRRRVREDFDRIARSGGGESEFNERFGQALIRELPPHVASALDVGCGTGSLCRRLERVADSVIGIDLSSEMIRLARERGAGSRVEYRAADLFEFDGPPASFDVITSVATLHHLPLAPALMRLAGWLRPGGVLLVLDLMSAATPADFLRFAHTWLTRRWPGAPHAPLTAEARRAWDLHGALDRYPTLREVRECARALPGALVRPQPEYRYLLKWERPPADG